MNAVRREDAAKSRVGVIEQRLDESDIHVSVGFREPVRLVQVDNREYVVGNEDRQEGIDARQSQHGFG